MVRLRVVTCPRGRSGLSFSLRSSSSRKERKELITLRSFSPAVLGRNCEPWPGCPLHLTYTSGVCTHQNTTLTIYIISSPLIAIPHHSIKGMSVHLYKPVQLVLIKKKHFGKRSWGMKMSYNRVPNSGRIWWIHNLKLLEFVLFSTCNLWVALYDIFLHYLVSHWIIFILICSLCYWGPTCPK